MVSTASVVRWFLGLAVGVLFIVGLWILTSRFPTLSFAGTTVRTMFLVGIVIVLVFIPIVISEYQSGEQRKVFQFGLFAVGVAMFAFSQYSMLALSQNPIFHWLGIFAMLASAGIGLKLDRRILGTVS